MLLPIRQSSLASTADLEKEGLTLGSDESPRSPSANSPRADCRADCPHWSHALGFTLLGAVLSAALLAVVLTNHEARVQAQSFLAEADGESRMQQRVQMAPMPVYEMAPETTPAPAVCDDCVDAWDVAKVEDICLGVQGAEMRRLLEEFDAEHLDEDVDATERRLGEDDPTKIMRYPVPNGGNFMYYGSQDLNQPRINAKNMVLFIHGAGRNAQDYFCTLRHLIDESRLENQETLMITPRFSYRSDEHEQTDCVWNGSRPMGDWRAGGITDPKSPCKMSSFELFDYIVHLAGDKEKFPLLTDVKVLGFSAGGQTVHRYSIVSAMAPNGGTAEQVAAMKAVHDHVTVRYIVGNPSSYAYLDDKRWIYDCGPEVPGGCTTPSYATYTPELGRRGWDSERGNAGLRAKSASTPFICRDSTFNEWGYGLNWGGTGADGVVPYLRQHENLTRAVKEWFPARKIVYLVGQRDTCTGKLLGFCFDSCWRKDDQKHPCFSTIMDSRCPAMLQGPNRAERAKNYMQHLQNFYGFPVHRLFLIPGVGHQAEVELRLALQMKLNHEISNFRHNTDAVLQG